MAKIGNNTFLVGCDPEVFVVNDNGDYIGAHGLIAGSKTEPLAVPNGMVQVDGMALEFGVDPCANKGEFVYRVTDVMKTLQSMLPKGLHLAVTPIALFSDAEMARAPEEALELGCDPDYSGYTAAINPRPTLANPNMRSAGGHVHVGYMSGADVLDPAFIKSCAALAVEMDTFLGIPSLGWDKDAQRRAIYGAAGAFRPKRYGMEYRSLSNQWLLDEELIGFVYDQTIRAVQSVIENPIGKTEREYFSGAVTVPAHLIINNNWTDLGTSVYRQMKKGLM